MRESIRALLVMICLAVSLPASATPLTFTFTGHVTFIDPVVSAGSISLGDTLNGTFVFDDTATLDVPNSSTTFARYASPDAPLSATIGSYALSGNAEMAVWNVLLEDLYQVITNNQWDFPRSSLVAASIAGYVPYAFVLNFEDDTGTALNSLELVPPDLASYSGRRFDINFLDANNNFADLGGTVDSLSIVAAVPEPATLTLTALGMAGVVNRYRRSRSMRLSS